jgi:hypothetical protein
MITTYNAKVKYPKSAEPYDAGRGPSHNVGLEILDGNKNPDPSAPKTKEDGVTNIYKNVNDGDAIAYMDSLSVGDEIQVQYNGKYYDFVVPAGWTPPPPKAQQSTNVVTSSLKEFSPLTEGEMAALQTLLDEETALTMYALHKLGEHLGNVEFPDGTGVSPDIMLQTASGHRVSALIRHNRGQEAIPQYHEGGARLAMFEDYVDESNLVVTALEAIVKFAPTPYSSDMLRDDMNGIGVAALDFATVETAKVVAKTIWEMLELIEGGMKRDVAISSTRQSYKV